MNALKFKKLGRIFFYPFAIAQFLAASIKYDYEIAFTIFIYALIFVIVGGTLTFLLELIFHKKNDEEDNV